MEENSRIAAECISLGITTVEKMKDGVASFVFLSALFSNYYYACNQIKKLIEFMVRDTPDNPGNSCSSFPFIKRQKIYNIILLFLYSCW